MITYNNKTILNNGRSLLNSVEIFNLTWTLAGSKTLPVTTTGTYSFIDKNGVINNSTYSATVLVNDSIILTSSEPDKITAIEWVNVGLGGTNLNFDILRNIVTLRINNAFYTGSIPSISNNIKLQRLEVQACSFTGSIPDVSKNINLITFNCSSNSLTGTIPSLTNATALQIINFSNNSLTGSIPSFATQTYLNQFYCANNALTGAIPSFGGKTSLVAVAVHSNQLTSYTSGTLSTALGSFQAQNNLLTQVAVDAILQDFVTAGRTGAGTINVGGTGNATPSVAGLANKAILQGRGWTVTTN